MVGAKSAFSSIFFLGLLFATSRASSNEISKVAFEQKTGVFVWKMSGPKEKLDQGDDLTDLTKSCNTLETSSSTNSQKLLSERAKTAPIFSTLAEVNTEQLLRKLGIDKNKLKLNPVMADIGRDDKPIFFLFPEVHMSYSTRALHRSLANDLLKITHTLDRKRTRVLNTYEGPQDTWEKTRDTSPRSVRERNIAATALFDKLNYSAFRIIGEVYNDRIETEYHDDNDLAIKNILALQANEHSKRGIASVDGWKQGSNFLKQNLPGRARLVDLEEYESYYEDLRRLDAEKLKAKASELCEERSSEMAKYTMDLARRRRAQVIYMSFGALHAHGIIEQLKKDSASFIVFSPNL